MKYGADRKHKPRLAQAWPLDELTYSPLSDPGEDARDGGPRCWAVAPAAPRETQPRAEITAALAGVLLSDIPAELDLLLDHVRVSAERPVLDPNPR